MAQMASTSSTQQTQNNTYANSDQVAMWQNILANGGSLAQYMMNNYAYPGGVAAQVAAPTDLTNQYWAQVAANAGMPDVSGAQNQMTGIGAAMNGQLAPTSYNFAPGQANLPTTFANGTPTVTAPGGVAGTAAAYQYNPLQVSGPTVQAPGAINPITGIAQIQAPSLQNYQMGPAQQVNAPSLSNFQMQAASPITAGQTTTPQSWNDPGTAASYMSPYESNVMNVQSQAATLASQQQQQANDAAAVQAGAFGGSRQAIVTANTDKDLQTQLAQIQATGLQNAYTQGQQQFNTQQQAGQQAQQFNVGTGLQASLANQQAQQQANVQNLSSFLQTQGLGAQTGLQSQMANQSAGLQVGSQNLAANLQTQGLGAQMNMQGQLANQSMDYQTQVANQQAQEFGAGQQLQAGLANAGYNMQGQLANQASGLQAGLAANQLGFQGSTFNATQQQQAEMANQAAQMQAMGLQYQGGLQSALQTQNLGYQGQVQGAQMGLAASQANTANLAQQGNLALNSGQLGLQGYQLGLQGMTQLANAASSQQGYQQQIADTQYNNWLNSMQLPMQAEMAYAQMAAMSPSWGQTTTSANYGTGQTNQPTINWGQIAGGALAAAGQVGAAAAGAKRGGLLSIDRTGAPRFAEGGLAAADKESVWDKAAREIGSRDAYSRFTRAPIHISNDYKNATDMVQKLKASGIQSYIEGGGTPADEPATGEYDDKTGIRVNLNSARPTYRDLANTVTHEDIHALLQRAGIKQPDIPSHMDFFGFDTRDKAFNGLSRGNRAGDPVREAPAYVGAYDPDQMPGFTQGDRQDWIDRFTKTLPPKVADMYQRMLRNYQASQGTLPTNAPNFAEGGLAAVTPFRRRLYAPLRRHHNYPATRRRPLEGVMTPTTTMPGGGATSGLGNIAYA